MRCDFACALFYKNIDENQQYTIYCAVLYHAIILYSILSLDLALLPGPKCQNSI